jgi:hypothetical protein
LPTPETVAIQGLFSALPQGLATMRRGNFVNDRKRLAAALLVASLCAAPLGAQDAPAAAGPEAEACQSFKFETVVVIDPSQRRGSRVRLCANPGASEADWVKTLEDAIVQIRQGTMPAVAKADLVAQIEDEIARYRPKPALADTLGGGTWNSPAASSAVTLGKDQLGSSGATPEAPFAVSTLPSLDRPKAAAGGAKAEPIKPMGITVKCLAPGDRGPGMTCDYFSGGTVLAVRAIRGMEDGAVLRFLRRGEERGEVELQGLAPGRVARVALPAELCRVVKTSRVEIAVFPPRSSKAFARGAAGRVGPYGLRC